MTNEQIIRYAPLLLAALTAMIYGGYFVCIHLVAATPKWLAVALRIWGLLGNIAAFVFVVGFYFPACLPDRYAPPISFVEGSCRMLTLMLFGVTLPSYAVAGYVASRFPKLWERHQALARACEAAKERAATRSS